MSLFKMKDEPVSDRTPFLGIGNYMLELVEMGRGMKRDGSRYSYLTYKVLESDRADHAVGTSVTKWIQDGSFSVQKDIKIAVGALLNKAVSTLEFGEIVPFFYPEDKKEPENGEKGTGTDLLAGRKVRVSGRFPEKVDKVTKVKTVGTYPQHDFFPLDPPLD